MRRLLIRILSFLLWPITLRLDGDQWCALSGSNLQEGEAAFGDTPEEALLNFLRK